MNFFDESFFKQINYFYSYRLFISKGKLSRLKAIGNKFSTIDEKDKSALAIYLSSLSIDLSGKAGVSLFDVEKSTDKTLSMMEDLIDFYIREKSIKKTRKEFQKMNSSMEEFQKGLRQKTFLEIFLK